MSPQLIQIAECLNEANTREIKIARCLAESLKRIQELEQSKTEASQQAKEAEKRFSAALHDLAEQLTKTGEETTSIAQHLSNQINTEKEQFSAELSNVVDQLTKTSEQAKVEFGYKVDEIALKLAELPAQMAAFKAEFAIPSVQADAPKSFNPRGAYENGEKYQPFDYVSANGSSYIALVENPTEPPSKKSKQWMLVAARGASGSGGIISASEVVGLGTAAFRDVGQAAKNVLELSGPNEITVGDGGGPSGFVNIIGPDGAVSISNDGGQLLLTDSFAGSIYLGDLALLSQVGDRYLTSSTTSNTISNGAKTFTVGTGLAYTPTQDVTIAHDASNHMHAAVTTYNSITGELVVDVNSHTGTGDFTAWTVNVGGISSAVLPTGGATGTVLTKASATDYDAVWSTPSVAVSGITGLGTGVATALTVNAGSAGSPVVNGGALGTPSSGTVTNLTGTASINVNGTVGATTPASGAFTTIDASGLIRLAGSTSSFPALKRSGATIEVRLADDSLQAGVAASFFTAGQNTQQGAVSCTNSSGGSVLQMSGSVSYGFHAALNTCFSWGSNATLNGSKDTSLSRVAAGVVGVGSGGSAGDVTGAISLNEIRLSKTITAVGTTGAQTINKSSGAVNFAAAASSLVVTNSLVTVNSVIQLTVGTNDMTCRSAIAVAAAGSFTIYPTTAPTSETKVFFTITN